MIRAGNLLAEAGRVLAMAGTATAQPDWTPVAERIRKEATDYWDDTVAVDRFTGKGGRFVRGRAQLLGSGRVVAGGQVFQTRRGVVLATGTVPAVPDSLIVLGGGAVGLELAQVFSRFGVTVTVVEAAERLLPTEEPEASGLIHQVLIDEDVAAAAAPISTVMRSVCSSQHAPS